MIKINELNAEMRSLLACLENNEVYIILEWATDIMDESQLRRGHARLGCNGAVELACALVLFLDKSNTQNGKGNCDE
jgi:hypothetical protein